MKWLLVLACLLFPLSLQAQTTGPETVVVDGDTLRIGAIRYRLHGIDAPEKSQKCEKNGVAWLCGQDAAAYLRRLVEGRSVACEEKDRDRYGRVVAVCRAGSLDLNRAMVRAGLAWAYTAYSADYLPAEQEARQAGAGVWAPGAAAEPAWDWRRREREKAARIRG
ncbi:thermonuclease family protein [Ferrovibrio sp.]|uniref:thermonuclease family protein n=1 Tax=Ferrovibrio sp. TaxID=1917215 RepID=UPI00311D3C17